MTYFTNQDIKDLNIAFDMCKEKRNQNVAEFYNEDILELSDIEIKEELRKSGIIIHDNLIIIRHEGYIEFVLE